MQYGRYCRNVVGIARHTCAYRGGVAEDSRLNTVLFGIWLPDYQTSFICPSTGTEKSKKSNSEILISALNDNAGHPCILLSILQPLTCSCMPPLRTKLFCFNVCEFHLLALR